MRFYCFLLVFFLSQSAFGQEKGLKADFIVDFRKSLNGNFSEDDLNRIFRKYSELLTPGSDVTQLRETLEGKSFSLYPLNDLKGQQLYTDNISVLLNSPNPNRRILAYLVIAASGDISKESILIDRIKSNDNGHALWAGMALLYFGCDRTTPLFDFLVKNENFGDAHMLPLYITLNKDSLQQTAYNRINSTNIKAKVLAAQILAVTPLNTKTASLLMQAVQNWDIKIKGYAIYSVEKLQMGNLLETFRPLVDSPQTRSIALGALANSPTSADQNYLLELLNKPDTVSSDLLNCFYKSTRPDNVKLWLKLLCERLIPKGYYFSVFDNLLIHSNYVLPDLQAALSRTTNPDILGELVRALEGRDDDLSIGIMVNLLKNSNSTVRYWTAKTFENNPSPKLKSPEIQKLIAKGLKDG